MDIESLEKSSFTNPVPDSLCSACQTINGEALLKTRPFEWGTHYTHYNEGGKLEREQIIPSDPGAYHTLFLENPAASVETCAACKLFHNVVHGGITLSEPTMLELCLKKDRRQVEVEDVVKVERQRERAQKMVEAANPDGKGVLSVFADRDTITAQEFPLRRIGQPGSAESITCIRRWLDECDSKHPTCKLGLVGDVIEIDPQMPARVIDVGSFDCHHPPRLLETNGLKGRYIAVSHSWGTLTNPYTVKENLEALKNAIDVENLPKTFQDSIYIARKLNVPYVWIDSVCIIQDDHEDWKREAKTMGFVYEKAYLAISASESPGDHVGFLTPNLWTKKYVTLPFHSGQANSEYICLRGLYRGCIEPQRTAISKRGWVLQERTLSRRILHFDGSEVHWECSQYLASEGGDKRDTTSNVNTSYFLGQNIRPLVEVMSGTCIPNHVEYHKALVTLYHFYACKVHEFSLCKLTIPSDKLPAILGLGNEISRGTGIRFVEGHFLFDDPLLVYSLLWYTEMFSVEGSGIPDHIRAPSWSWAAMEGPRVFYILGQDIKFERRIFLKIKRVLELEILNLRPYNALECFGKVIAAKKGEFFLDRNFRNLGWNDMWNRREEEEFQPPASSYQLLKPIEDTEEGWPLQTNAKCWVCFDSEEFVTKDLFFIPVCAPVTSQEHTHPMTTRLCLGLVVLKAYIREQSGVSGITNAYKRVGFGGLKDTSWFDQQDEMSFLLI